MSAEIGFLIAWWRQACADQIQAVADGRIHRFRVEGDKAGSRNGWCVLYADLSPWCLRQLANGVSTPGGPNPKRP